ncbi:MAG: DUF4316 domain-containing protein, partial [Parasporobacterium sp.]|nr:DUF4316 domain-containing protein [Parasporobacterium sp.]
MSNGRKQFAVYRLKKGLWENEALRYRSWNYLQKFHIQVQSDRYEQICVSPFLWDLDPSDLRRQLENGLPAAPSGEKLEVSDVLVVTKDGITTAYYVDPEKLIVLTGFFHTTASTALLSIDTTDYQIEGRAGNFLAADEIWIDGQHFFLMQSQQFGKNAAYVILDSNGKVAAEDTTIGFTEEVVRQIREYMQRQNAAKEISARAATPPLENWQKSFENGEYLRSAEMAEEQNYSMIDGRMNNMPPKGPVHRRLARKRRKGKLPMKGRESVLKRLKEYQDELAAQ